MYVLCVLELSWMREGNGGDVEGEEGGGRHILHGYTVKSVTV